MKSTAIYFFLLFMMSLSTKVSAQDLLTKQSGIDSSTEQRTLVQLDLNRDEALGINQRLIIKINVNFSFQDCSYYWKRVEES